MGEATPSHFAMFRAMIALAWADHRLDDSEQERIMVYLENNPRLSESQRRQLAQELQQPVSLDAVWPDITDLQDRAHLVNIADAIFWEDGEFCHSEKEVYERIKSAHIATLDMDFIRADIARYRQQLADEHGAFNARMEQLRGPVGRALAYLESVVDRLF